MRIVGVHLRVKTNAERSPLARKGPGRGSGRVDVEEGGLASPTWRCARVVRHDGSRRRAVSRAAVDEVLARQRTRGRETLATSKASRGCLRNGRAPPPGSRWIGAVTVTVFNARSCRRLARRRLRGDASRGRRARRPPPSVHHAQQPRERVLPRSSPALNIIAMRSLAGAASSSSISSESGFFFESIHAAAARRRARTTDTRGIATANCRAAAAGDRSTSRARSSARCSASGRARQRCGDRLDRRGHRPAGRRARRARARGREPTPYRSARRRRASQHSVQKPRVADRAARSGAGLLGASVRVARPAPCTLGAPRRAGGACARRRSRASRRRRRRRSARRAARRADESLSLMRRGAHVAVHPTCARASSLTTAERRKPATPRRARGRVRAPLPEQPLRGVVRPRTSAAYARRASRWRAHARRAFVARIVPSSAALRAARGAATTRRGGRDGWRGGELGGSGGAHVGAADGGGRARRRVIDRPRRRLVVHAGALLEHGSGCASKLRGARRRSRTVARRSVSAKLGAGPSAPVARLSCRTLSSDLALASFGSRLSCSSGCGHSRAPAWPDTNRPRSSASGSATPATHAARPLRDAAASASSAPSGCSRCSSLSAAAASRLEIEDRMNAQLLRARVSALVRRRARPRGAPRPRARPRASARASARRPRRARRRPSRRPRRHGASGVTSASLGQASRPCMPPPAPKPPPPGRPSASGSSPPH